MLNISNAKYYRDDTINYAKRIAIEDGKITSIENAESINPEYLVVPGFIDLQIYGAGGRLFSAEPTIESLTIMEDDLLRKGTTGFLACMATNSPEVFKECINTAKSFAKQARNFLGLHLEGPYLNRKRLGAHIPEFVRMASLDEIKELLDRGDGVIKMMTIAPECQDEKVIQYLLDHKVLVSLGHSDASFIEATMAYDNGIKTTTHLFNAMSPVHHRKPGIPTAFFNHQKAMASIIVDGEHLDYEVVKIAYKLSKGRLFLITDAVTPCNIPPYQHIQKDNKFVMPDGTLSGSSLTMLKALQNCVNHCNIEVPEAIKMSSLYPGKLIGGEEYSGSIEVGSEANLLLLNQNLELQQVIFKGESISTK
ncbi:N-acetylglucosamine-6-phosphate deacetylase [Pedobacter frigidisoli]|uniref:N-acetylglucosamine-6-phosphate deacetylase n=1 Tax=Pedobacter frigidisoli TaxID=2530455 RepID=UPI00292EE60B|nr:N-acetylglucosamine-6-phosphate deacetylase [Pedobacter frigidisoli]